MVCPGDSEFPTLLGGLGEGEAGGFGRLPVGYDGGPGDAGPGTGTWIVGGPTTTIGLEGVGITGVTIIGNISATLPRGMKASKLTYSFWLHHSHLGHFHLGFLELPGLRRCHC